MIDAEDSLPKSQGHGAQLNFFFFLMLPVTQIFSFTVWFPFALPDFLSALLSVWDMGPGWKGVPNALV